MWGFFLCLAFCYIIPLYFLLPYTLAYGSYCRKYVVIKWCKWCNTPVQKVFLYHHVPFTTKQYEIKNKTFKFILYPSSTMNIVLTKSTWIMWWYRCLSRSAMARGHASMLLSGIKIRRYPQFFIHWHFFKFSARLTAYHQAKQRELYQYWIVLVGMHWHGVSFKLIQQWNVRPNVWWQDIHLCNLFVLWTQRLCRTFDTFLHIKF